MGHSGMGCGLATAGVALVLAAGPACATITHYYETDSATLAAPGTILSGGTGTGGGLCVPGSGACPALGFGETAGALTGGLITISSSTPGLGSYLLSLNLTGLGSQSDGSIWDVTLVNGSASRSLGITNIVAQGSLGSGSISQLLTGTGTFTIGITDLLEQYEGQKDTLPKVLGNAADDSLSGTISSTSSLFTLSYTLTAVPEPSSFMLLGGGMTVLAAVRRCGGH